MKTMGDPSGRLSAVDLSTDDVTFGEPVLLYVGGTGDLAVVAWDDTAAVPLKAHPVGYCPVQIKTVKKTGTTATNIVALKPRQS